MNDSEWQQTLIGLALICLCMVIVIYAPTLAGMIIMLIALYLLISS